eukprot:TRINITY_DN27689_c0_g2_i1.p1 TRINITY_DN27689_c0_g2~~TRINITY_DN27689_c0_g2_i1.p1  ORF type:complete len:1261 (+),score=164.87 TRINITY_DN27689_c0_g2_i1:476-3784(+)
MAVWDGSLGTDEADTVVSMLLKVAPHLAADCRLELWNALGELRSSPWLTDAALLQLTNHCLASVEPAVVAAFLVARIGEHRLQPSDCIDFCLSQLIAWGKGHLRPARLLHMLVGGVSRTCVSQLIDLVLPSLASVVEWAVAGRATSASLPHFCAAMELLLQHLVPSSLPERSWASLRQLLASRQRDALPPPMPLVSPLVPGLPVHCDEEDHSTSVVPQPLEHQQFDSEPPGASGGEAAHVGELNSTFSRVHRLVVELSKSEGQNVPSTLQLIAQVLTRSQCVAPLRAFLRRLLTRQRSRNTMKENLPPSGPHGLAKQAIFSKDSSSGDFIEDDYASLRELAADEGLVGAFPLSLFGNLKWLLMSPAAAGIHRAAAECLGAAIAACGPLMLRVVLHMFAGALLRIAGVRGPAQAAARATMGQLITLCEQPSPSVASAQQQPRWLKHVWRAFVQAAGRGKAGLGAVSGDPNLIVEALRWLVDDVLTLPGVAIGAGDVREMLIFVGPALQDRNMTVRCTAARAVQMLSKVRGESVFREDVRSVNAFSGAVKKSVLNCLGNVLTASPIAASNTAPAIASTPPGRACRRSPSTPTTTPSAQSAPSGAGQSSSNGGLTRSASSKPRRLQFSPAVEETSCDSGPNSPAQPAHRRTRLGSGDGLIEGRLPPSVAMSDLQLARKRAAEARAAEGARVTDTSPAFAFPSAALLAPFQVGQDYVARSTYRPPCRAPSPDPSFATHGPESPSTLVDSTGHRIEEELREWIAELDRTFQCDGGSSSAWARAAAALVDEERVGEVNGRLEAFFLRGGGATEALAPVVVATLSLCERFVRGAVVSELVAVTQEGTALKSTPSKDSWSTCNAFLAAALGVASAARGGFTPAALRRLCAASAAPALRASLRALAQLQQLSRSASDAVRRVAARALLELPPLLASLIDSVEAATQLVAWVRVAGEVLNDTNVSQRANIAENVTATDAASTRRWALRFCARCVERCVPQLPADCPEFPAWEVLSELSRLYAKRSGEGRGTVWSGTDSTGDADSPTDVTTPMFGGVDSAWNVDNEEWFRALETASVTVSRRYPAQSREFFLLASCAGSPLPASLQRLATETN